METLQHRHWRHRCAALAIAAAGAALLSFGLLAALGGDFTASALAGPVAGAAARGASPQAAFEPRCAQPVVRFSISENSSYIPIAIAPTTTRPENARPICIDEPAEISR